ncbi:hypothetical protein [Amycolatopsis sp. FDAARGOS 1241]|uniref:hypothetical protein n=1 Tax=Amycolatopsis sp. FDAARGOS 1241 TaxID=2778070 RepID=UPI00194F2477|nr:hypothetical protein [Amycolatopsis sp. FDAARGOS 1241]QRP50110.1 hypothetical protein I6J71_21820 [Amycolatopsis sp. FDAARGOS 1241]
MVRRRSWLGAAMVVPAFTVAGCAQTITGQASPAAPAANEAPARPSSSYPSPDGATATIATMTVTLPAGTQYAVESRDPGYEGCLQSASFACEGKILDLREAAGAGLVTLPSPTRRFGWYPGTDVPSCLGPTSDPGVASQATGSTVLEHGFAPVGPKKAEYARFAETCQDPAQNNQVRMWWLPQSKILIVEHSATSALDAAFDGMLASATFS